MRKNIFGTRISGIFVILVWCLIVSGCQKQEQPVVTRMKIVDAPLQKSKIPPATKEKAIKTVMPTEEQIPKPSVAPVDAEVEKARTTFPADAPPEDTMVFQPDAQPMLPDIQKLTYNPEGKIDPFVPLFKNETAAKPGEKSERKKRIPQTPLENLDLSQIKLTAIYQTSRGFSALVEESSGKGYVINVGTYIGRNSGKVIAIHKEAVRIEEEIEDALGNMRIETRELKLPKPVGEL